MEEITTLNVQFTPGAVASASTMHLVRDKINELVGSRNEDHGKILQIEGATDDIDGLSSRLDVAETNIRQLQSQARTVYITQEAWDILERTGTWQPDTEYNILE